MSLQIDKDTKVVCARHPRFEFEASYNLGCNDISVRGVCPECLVEARDADAQHMQRQLTDYHKGHLHGTLNVQVEYPQKIARICFGDHSAHSLCEFVEYQRIERPKP